MQLSHRLLQIQGKCCTACNDRLVIRHHVVLPESQEGSKLPALPVDPTS